MRSKWLVNGDARPHECIECCRATCSHRRSNCYSERYRGQSMLILAFKLLITPLLIGSVTLAGRRWGSIVSGMLIGLPLTSGPISFILALEYGQEFASQSAVGNLAGQISNCVFCLAYIGVARSCSWKISSIAAIAAFFTATFVLNLFSWQLWPALSVLLVFIVFSARLVSQHSLSTQGPLPPKWDLPARVVCATALVIILTAMADRLGPQLSGLISPFPAFSVIFAAFTHSQQGGKSASNLLRGVIVGSGGYAAFFTVVGTMLTSHGVAITYLAASLASIVVGASTLFLTKRIRCRISKN
jgi:hypothetical protein